MPRRWSDVSPRVGADRFVRGAQVAVWLGPRGGRPSACGDGGEAAAPSTRLSSLCTLPGVAKQLPLVVHAHGHSLYEEPCLQWLSLRIREARPPRALLGLVGGMALSTECGARTGQSPLALHHPCHGKSGRV